MNEHVNMSRMEAQAVGEIRVGAGMSRSSADEARGRVIENLLAQPRTMRDLVEMSGISRQGIESQLVRLQFQKKVFKSKIASGERARRTIHYCMDFTKLYQAR